MSHNVVIVLEFMGVVQLIQDEFTLASSPCEVVIPESSLFKRFLARLGQLQAPPYIPQPVDESPWICPGVHRTRVANVPAHT